MFWLNIGVAALLLSFVAPAQAQTATTVLDAVRICSNFAGADAGAKIAACIADLPSTGGTADARGLQGSQTWSACPFTRVTKPVTVVIGGATHSSSVSCTVPSSVTLDLAQGGIVSMAAATTATINGSVIGPPSQHFAGAGDVLLNGPLHDVPVQWFGALGDGATDDTTAVQKTVTSLTGKGGVFYFPSSGRYKITGTITVSSKRPIHMRCDMFGSVYDTTAQGNGAILLGGTIAGPMFKWTSDSADRAATGGGSVEGCVFIDAANRRFTATAVLDLHDFPLSQVRNNVFQYIKGSAILGEFLVQSEISSNIIRYCGDRSRPAIDLQNGDGVHVAQSLKIDGNRIEVIYDAEYLKVASVPFDISVIDNRFEADTAIAATNGEFIDSAAAYNRFIGNEFNRNTGTQFTLSGAGNTVIGNVFRGGAYATTAFNITGGRNSVTGNIFSSNRTALEVSMVGTTNFTANNMYSSGCLLVNGATGSVIASNTLQDLTCTTTVLGSGSDFWINTGASSHNVITGNVLDNTSGPVRTVGGIRLGGSLNSAINNSLKSFAGSGSGAQGILIASNRAVVTDNTISTAPIVTSFTGGAFSDNPAGTISPEASVTWNPPNVAALGRTSVTVALIGATASDFFDVSFTSQTRDFLIGAVGTANQVDVTLFNIAGGAVDLPSGTLRIKARK